MFASLNLGKSIGLFDLGSFKNNVCRLNLEAVEVLFDFDLLSRQKLLSLFGLPFEFFLRHLVRLDSELVWKVFVTAG